MIAYISCHPLIKLGQIARFTREEIVRLPMRPKPSMQRSGSFAQPMKTNDWLIGIFLLILSEAPSGSILVPCYEESGPASTVGHSEAVHRVP